MSCFDFAYFGRECPVFLLILPKKNQKFTQSEEILIFGKDN
jgi:hypothetical protein